jgi:ketosteroid isomerase-like protein
MATKRARKKTPKPASKPLARRVMELEDRDAIRTLVQDMNWLADEDRLDDLLACFTDDLVYDVGAFGTYHGKQALRGFYEQTVRPFKLRIHTATNQVVELRGERAKSRCYWKAELELQGRALNSSGHYLDELVKRSGQWKIARRTATITYMCPLDEGWAKTRMMTLG